MNEVNLMPLCSSLPIVNQRDTGIAKDGGKWDIDSYADQLLSRERKLSIAANIEGR